MKYMCLFTKRGKKGELENQHEQRRRGVASLGLVGKKCFSPRWPESSLVKMKVRGGDVESKCRPGSQARAAQGGLCVSH